MLLTAADVTDSAADSGQLIPMLEQAEETTETRVPVMLADGGYHTARSLLEGELRGDTLVIRERYHADLGGPYFKDRFVYDTATDSYLCPLGQRISFQGYATKMEGFQNHIECTGLQGRYAIPDRLWGLHQRRTFWTCTVDRADRCLTSKAPPLDGDRAGEGSVCVSNQR